MITSLPSLSAAAPGRSTPVTTGLMETADIPRLARMFKALGDPTRVQLLSMIAAKSGAEACVCDLTEPVGLSQPTVSHHLKQLVDAGLVTREQRGKWAFYALVPETLAMLSGVLDPYSLLRAGAAASSRHCADKKVPAQPNPECE